MASQQKEGGEDSRTAKVAGALEGEENAGEFTEEAKGTAGENGAKNEPKEKKKLIPKDNHL